MLPQHAERGQVLAVAAMAMAVLLAFAGLAIDVGRQLAERRHLQNAADAAALAGCDALIDGASNGNAEATARQIANTNLDASSGGASRNLAGSGAQAYEPGHSGDPRYLTNGIVITDDGTVRVAISSTMTTVLGRVIGVGTMYTGARAMCRTLGQAEIPILARRYLRAPGPGGGFTDHMATRATSRNGAVDTVSVVGYGGRTAASRAEPGPEFTLYGPNSKADNMSSFHGFVAFDIRNYLEDDSRVYLNGVPAGANPSTTRASQSAYITDGYPGPEFPPATSPPDPNDQVAVIGGMDTAHTVVPLNQEYDEGDELMLGLYSGTVMEIADFNILPPEAITLPSNGTQSNAGNFTVSRDRQFNMSVALSLVGDTNAPDTDHNIVYSPWTGATPPNNSGKFTARFDVNNFVPDTRGTRVQMRDFVTKGIDAGIYTVWLQGAAGSPVYRIHRYPIGVRVGGAVRDFNLDNSTLSGETPTSGGVISIPIYVHTKTDSTAWGGGAVTLSVDAASLTDDGLPASQVTFSPSSVTPSSSGDGALSTLNINTTGLAPGLYDLDIRATGRNGANQDVTHLEEITFGVGLNPGDRKYVDIIGFAMFRITNIRNNSISIEAISPVYASADDPALRAQQHARLVPWQ